MAVGRWTLMRVAARALLIQASWSPERMQSVGFAFAMMPALRRLYPDRGTYLARLAVHLEYFNTQPYLASFILGAAVRLEEERAAGGNPAADAPALKGALMGPLGALGDSVYWGGLKPFAAAVAAALALAGAWWAPLVFLAVYNAWHLRQRVRLVSLGYDSAGDISALVGRYPLMKTARAFKLVSLAVLGGLAASAPFWRAELRLPVALPAVALAGGALGVTLALAALMRAGLSPIRLMLAVAALCAVLVLSGVVG